MRLIKIKEEMFNIMALFNKKQCRWCDYKTRWFLFLIKHEWKKHKNKFVK